MELGVDPGIDHMSAMQMLDEIRDQGQAISSFASFCGGLPTLEPEKFKQNLLKHKLSWSPKGVLRALGNDAAFLEAGEVQKIPSEKLLQSVQPFSMTGHEDGSPMEYLANRDSLKYIEIY